ncbi:unnamed protein product [Calypogeia fissa]
MPVPGCHLDLSHRYIVPNEMPFTASSPISHARLGTRAGVFLLLSRDGQKPTESERESNCAHGSQVAEGTVCGNSLT